MTSHHDLRQALNEARAAFTRLTDVFEATLGELARVNTECEDLRTRNQVLNNTNTNLQVQANELRDRIWTIETERDNATTCAQAAVAARDSALASLVLAQDEIRKLRDVILNVAVAIDNEVKVDPKPAQGSSPSFSAIDEARDAAHDGTRPITAQALSESQEREIAEVYGDGFRPAYA